MNAESCAAIRAARHVFLIIVYHNFCSKIFEISGQKKADSGLESAIRLSGCIINAITFRAAVIQFASSSIP